MNQPEIAQPVGLDPAVLAAHTHARVALGRSGNALPTKALLAFQADHGMAREAVNASFEPVQIQDACAALDLPCIQVDTQAATQAQYLQNPQAGRQLTRPSWQHLRDSRGPVASRPDIVFVVSGGLSPSGVSKQAGDLLTRVVQPLRDLGLRFGPVVLADRARVGIINGIGEALDARSIVILIGERPGLTVPDSMGAYFEYDPAPDRTDVNRNCISNIHSCGLQLVDASEQLVALICAGLDHGHSGVSLKPPPKRALQQTSPPGRGLSA